ncbi:hypothetical protein [Mycolicibacterium aichiense]|uniref:Uncharacterized protein n=1 Tax=Mycolicibacterium aichiense TaxID=1799 RepID=A0AAD1HSC5_9MYCO|nr:hypothetical protein [Mycolicibacterium aichiense]MCV7017240.1 hypothetical protein [Mycolicibacterium aichiense]BBX10330.1 hypothetical protein MAIC_51330 [Mycolicibacterium aichiense]
MGISLTDLERWIPGSIRAVAAAATTRANHVREVAHDQRGRGTLSPSEYNDAIRAALVATTGRDLYQDIDAQMSSRYNAVTETTEPK